MPWFASVWDEPSVDFLQPFNPICYKIPSASLTDKKLLRHVRETGQPVILSTGMSTMQQIREAVNLAREMGFFINASFILGAPIETKQHIENTIKLAISLPLI
jgi:sialic acid synthase SpsE